MWWKKTKVFSKQRLIEANLDPIPFIKERVRSEFARTVLEPLPVTQSDQGDQVEFQTDAIVLSLPLWERVKSDLVTLSENVSPAQRDTITQLIHSIENE
ncbi:hypothetical protein [Spirosoma pollinicola]|uniref:Uncharacterized protein n=1 Tax=Spirosoma pollinicola TaxID=2057025 RepID=A0A2K8YWF1_9BACT|nr:hypothetical protein [Spirosoma pollinicola]AUD01965.1 hypothetical protein CWM47_09125 [Spirosoma pollinicola]